MIATAERRVTQFSCNWTYATRVFLRLDAYLLCPALLVVWSCLRLPRRRKVATLALRVCGSSYFRWTIIPSVLRVAPRSDRRDRFLLLQTGHKGDPYRNRVTLQRRRVDYGIRARP